ncbi:MAG: thioredoxin family protein [Proteobacteria bacterium]|nr:thioredoxin family protein [Pseudomonadota bacterium]MBU1716769.1 thioredoxin family protein [Pseudomonadota bacterium]
MNDDTPLQRTLKIGSVSVGLVGLDLAFSHVLNMRISDQEAVDYLFTEISRQNYIPDPAATNYRQALLAEYNRIRGMTVQRKEGLNIRILGPGCVSCNRLNTMLIDIMQKLDIAADIEQVHDLDEIWRYGVLNTPALIINDEIKCAGRMPTPADIEQWIKESLT